MRSLLLKLHLHPSPLWIIFEINFFRHLAIAVMSAVLPIYFRKFVDSDAKVGIIFLIGYCTAFISHIFAAHIIEHLKKRKTLLLVLALFTILFGLFAVSRHTALILLIFAIYQFVFALLILDISLYVKHFSNYRQISENEGKLGSFGNIGWIIGPFLGGLIADRYGFETVFLFSSAVCLIALFTFFFIRLSHENVIFHHPEPLAKNIKQFFRDGNLRKTYLNNAGLGFIYSIRDYLSLLMFGLGASLPLIGLTRTLMGVPQTILEYPIGKLADRKTGERKIFIIGYALAAIFTFLLGITTDLRLFIAFFFIAATGTSFLEMTRDSYFFRQVSEKEVEKISVYRTSDALPFIIGHICAVIVLSFFSVKLWFMIGGAIALLFVFNAWRLKELKAS